MKLQIQNNPRQENVLSTLRQAQRVLKQAKLEAIEIRRAAENQIQEEIRATKEQNRKSLEKATSKLEDDYQELKNKLLQETRESMFKMVFTLTAQVIGEELQRTPQSIRQRVLSTLKDCLHLREFSITTNPMDRAYLEDLPSTLTDDSTRSITMKLQTSQQINPGEFLLRSSSGTIYSSPTQHLKAIQQRIQERLTIDG